MSRVRTLAALGPRRWPFVARVAATGAVAELAVRVVPLPLLARVAGVPLATDAPHDGDARRLLAPRDLARLDLAMRVVRARPLRATCLRRSLVAGHLLRRYHPRLRLGVAKDSGAVAAHAWIEVDGMSLDPESAAYRALPPTTAGRSPRRLLATA